MPRAQREGPADQDRLPNGRPPSCPRWRCQSPREMVTLGFRCRLSRSAAALPADRAARRAPGSRRGVTALRRAEHRAQASSSAPAKASRVGPSGARSSARRGTADHGDARSGRECLGCTGRELLGVDLGDGAAWVQRRRGPRSPGRGFASGVSLRRQQQVAALLEGVGLLAPGSTPISRARPRSSARPGPAERQGRRRVLRGVLWVVSKSRCWRPRPT